METTTGSDAGAAASAKEDNSADVLNRDFFVKAKTQKFSQDTRELRLWLLEKKGLESSHLNDGDDEKFNQFLVNFIKNCSKKWKESNGNKKKFDRVNAD